MPKEQADSAPSTTPKSLPVAGNLSSRYRGHHFQALNARVADDRRPRRLVAKGLYLFGISTTKERREALVGGIHSNRPTRSAPPRAAPRMGLTHVSSAPPPAGLSCRAELNTQGISAPHCRSVSVGAGFGVFVWLFIDSNKCRAQGASAYIGLDWTGLDSWTT